MTDVYTRYLSTLPTDGSPPDAGSFEEVVDQLHQDLRRELRRRGLWTLTPAYLGIAENCWDGDALEILVHEAYVYVFHERVRDLKRQLEVKKRRNVDGLVILNLRHCVTELQRKADPIGYRVFELSKAAILRSIGAGDVHVLSGGSKVRNDTVLSFDRRARSEDTCPDLDAVAGSRYDALLLEMIQARKRAVPKVVEKLTNLIVGLRDAGITAFRFKDLVDLLKRRVRWSWADAWASEGEVGFDEADDGRPMLVPVVHPRALPEEGAQALDEWLRCVVRWIEQWPKDRTVVWNLWKLLRSFTIDADPEVETPRRLSARKLGKVLGIDRERVPVLMRTIGRLVEKCRSGEDAQPTPRAGPRRTGEPSKNRSEKACQLPDAARREAS